MQSLYEKLGGDAGVRRLVDRFYDLMDTLPEAAGIRKLHPADLGGSRDKLYKFLSGWMGGPPLYMQEYGHPALRFRHLPFPIRAEERDAWMLCMTRALDETDLDAITREHLKQSLFKTADHMRNRDVPDAGPVQS
jgi:hemoglobin